jgi:2-polyprenyl-3-methyl-5-hydroxy-6-metoxy-1,4-benzoquinol methylase
MQFLDSRQTTHPQAVAAFRALLEAQPAYEGVVLAAQRRDQAFWDSAEERVWEIVSLSGGSPDALQDGIAAWIEFSYEFIVRQRAFQKTGHYAETDFESMKHKLYEDDERMKGFYLSALMFSFLFSSNYVGFFAFFRTEFLPRIEAAGAVCDIGCGHGVYLCQMLLKAPSSKGIGIDISAASLETAGKMLELRGVSRDRHQLVLGDVQKGLEIPSNSQDGVTCFEVIEHLADPDKALQEIGRILRRDGLACVSTAIRMESVDHLHLFKTPDEVRSLFRRNGLAILKDDVIPLTTENLDEPGTKESLIADPKVPLGFVALARKQHD